MSTPARTVTVEVTEADIAVGVAHSCNECPVALAVTRAGLTYVQVDRWRIYADELPSDGIELPDEGSDFITEFEMGFRVAPFTFTLTLPEGGD